MAVKVDMYAAIGDIKKQIQIKGIQLAHHATLQLGIINSFAKDHFREGLTILLHSASSVVLNVLKHVSERGIKVNVIVTAGHPSNTGTIVAEQCKEMGLPCKIILDSAVAVFMSKVDFVCVGCEAVMANGGIVNKVGTYSVALIAQHFQKPVYVFCESFKFVEDFPLGQDDVEAIVKIKEDKDVHELNVDYTPPEHIDLFFTDLGIFTSSGIADELNQFFLN
jgi:translation initiation factor eIF-2B subunit alpha